MTFEFFFFFYLSVGLHARLGDACRSGTGRWVSGVYICKHITGDSVVDTVVLMYKKTKTRVVCSVGSVVPDESFSLPFFPPFFSHFHLFFLVSESVLLHKTI